MSSTLPQSQEDFENHSMERGKQRFLDRVEKANRASQSGQVGAGLSLVRHAIQPLELSVDFTLTEGAKKRGVKHLVTRFIAPQAAFDACSDSAARLQLQRVKIEPSVIAYITVRTVLNYVMKPALLPAVACDIADLVLDELRYRRLQQDAPALFAWKMKSFDTSDYDHKAASLRHTLSTAQVLHEDGTKSLIDVSDLELTHAQRIQFGVWCIDRLLDIPAPLVTIEETKMPRKSARSHPRTSKVLVATPETLRWLRERTEVMQLLWPVALPMIEEPLPWAAGERGGYRYALRGKYPLVRGATKGHLRLLAAQPMQPVYDALNALQRTAWRINPDVSRVVQDIVEIGGGLGGISPLRPLPKPRKPHDIAENPDVRKRYRKSAAEVYDKNRQREKARRDMHRLRDVVDLFNEQPRLFFVYSIDFRGRVYPVCNYLTPQGDDISKALLTFSEGRPLGTDGARHLARHGANCLGETPDGLKVSKMTLDQRVAWIEAHTADIVAAAADPLSVTWWSHRVSPTGKIDGTDDPLQFYAFCCEWARLTAWRAAGNPDDAFISALPCSADGSCNGLQHFSALLRDPIGGKAVNLTPNLRPEDIYLQVMEATMRRVREDAASGNDLAVRWINAGVISRKLCKRPVMTFPYGSKVFGFKTQLVDYLKHRGETEEESEKLYAESKLAFSSPEGMEKMREQGDTRAPGDLLKPACGYLAGVIDTELRSIVVAASEAMQWLQQVARKVSGTQQCVSWTVPGTGYVVRQEYKDVKKREITTLLCGKVYKPVVYEATDKVAAVKQANAVSPNFIHSLDAAALMLTVRAAVQDGVRSFAMVHDSYGAPAGDCTILARCTREAFVYLYTQHDVIGGFHAQLRAMLPEKEQAKLQDPPQPGVLDLAGVHASDFFFA